MRIEQREQSGKITFYELRIGQAFYWGDALFIKVAPQHEINAVCLDNPDQRTEVTPYAAIVLDSKKVQPANNITIHLD